MKSLERLLKSYGLIFVPPRSGNLIINEILKKKQDDALKGVLELFAYGAKFKVVDIELLFEKFNFPEKYKEVEDVIRLGLYFQLRATNDIEQITGHFISAVPYREMVAVVEKKLKEGQNFGNVDPKKTALKAIFDEKIYTEEAERIIDFYYNLQTEKTFDMELERIRFIASVKKVLEKQTIDEEWLR